MKGALLIWVFGAILAFILVFNSAGEIDWNKYPPKWVAKYTFGQQVVYSLTWFIWFARFMVRLFRLMCVITWDTIVYMCTTVWDKWRNG